MFRIDQAIDRTEAALRELKRGRALLEKKLLNIMADQEVDSARGRTAVAGIRSTLIPTIKDRSKFQRFVIKTRSWDLFQNRVSKEAWQARIEDGIKVPGIEVFKRVRLSITKRSRG